MLTMYALTGIGFAALIYARCSKSDETPIDRIETAIAMVVAWAFWPVLLCGMVWKEAME